MQTFSGSVASQQLPQACKLCAHADPVVNSIGCSPYLDQRDRELLMQERVTAVCVDYPKVNRGLAELSSGRATFCDEHDSGA